MGSTAHVLPFVVSRRCDAIDGFRSPLFRWELVLREVLLQVVSSAVCCHTGLLLCFLIVGIHASGISFQEFRHDTDGNASSQAHRLMKTNSKQSKRRDLHLKWIHHETNYYTVYYYLPPQSVITSFTIINTPSGTRDVIQGVKFFQDHFLWKIFTFWSSKQYPQLSNNYL